MVRSHNEDSIATDAEIGLAVLADGMGGHNAGEVASRMAVATLMTEMRRLFACHKPHEVNGASCAPLAVRMVKENSAMANAQLVQLANDSGGSDNISVILVRVPD